MNTCQHRNSSLSYGEVVLRHPMFPHGNWCTGVHWAFYAQKSVSQKRLREMKAGRPPVPENTQLDVMLQVQDNPHSTTRQMGIDFNLSHTSVRNILHKQKCHPYKITLMHELSEDDFDRRNEFCEIMQIRCNEDENFSGNILFSDEASFFLNGTVWTTISSDLANASAFFLGLVVPNPLKYDVGPMPPYENMRMSNSTSCH
ncbi:hypothetical protein NQ318_004661 [Aromia moschata]|uniref:Transposase n=1 Tax=Aromia moschata TaxID=1265417 RepID=A0AAV8Y6T1_9CUCU|nr:hypothetical protein NQ318_004661 [Aromia moschata]